MAIHATIQERGNGFPNVGDYVPGDGRLYRVVSTNGRIQTGDAPGAANYIYATVAEAEWDDCDEGEEFPASVVLDDADDILSDAELRDEYERDDWYVARGR